MVNYQTQLKCAEGNILMAISSEASKEERSTTIPEGSTAQAGRKRLAPTEMWGEDIVSSAGKLAAVLEVFDGQWTVAEDSCWNWTGGKSHGYGQLRVHTVWGNTPIYAHRVAYMLNFGGIPKGLHICHHCDNEACVNPGHLFLGAAADNRRDSVNKGRQASGEKNGACKLTDDKVQEIRKQVAAGDKQYKVAKKFGISDAQVSRIVRGSRRSTASGETRNRHGNYKHGKFTSENL